MGRIYNKKTTQGQRYSASDLQFALDDIKNGKSLKKASKDHNIPMTTLKRHKDRKVSRPGEIKLGRFETCLPEEVEQEIANHVKDMSKRFHGMTSKEVRKLAFDVANEKAIVTRFNHEKEMAGEDWLRSFLIRLNLSLRSPQGTSLSRLVGFNEAKVNSFFQLLRETLNKFSINAGTFYNMDETGFSTVQRPQKVISQKGERTVGKVTSGERGQNVTAICAMSAAGTYVPPMFIFPRKNLKESLMAGSPPGSVGAVSDSGWTNDDLFMKWLEHFTLHVKCSQSDKCLLLVDGHSSHKTLRAVNFCRENGIEMISLPAHCTHKLQPLDRTYFKPLKTAYYKNCDSWMAKNPGKRITIHNVASLAGAAYMSVSTPALALNGFECCGLWPFNSGIFPPEVFLGAKITDEPETQERELPEGEMMSSDNSGVQIERRICEPSTSGLSSNSSESPNVSISAKRSLEYETSELIKKLSPFPKISTKRPRTRPSMPAARLTSTPEKIALELKDKLKSKTVNRIKTIKTKAVKKIFPGKESAPETEDCECIVCSDLFSRSRGREVWVKCAALCGAWAHKLCTNEENVYVCHECTPQ